MQTVAAALMVTLAASTAAAAPLVDPDTEIAQRHLKAGERRYDAQDYAGALVEFEAAQRLYPRPEFDFDIARCLDRLERFSEAVTAYERYLAQRPDDTNVKARVVVLRARITPAAVVAAGPPRRRFPGAAVGVGAGALALAIVGTALVASVKPTYKSVQASCPRSCPASRWSALRTRADVGYAAWGVAGALAIADVALWARWGRRPHATERVSLRPVLAPGALGLAGSF